MDHRIAKEMISSGMIPSGEKNKEDLSRTQYGTAPSPNALADVYKKMYEHHKKDADGNTIPHEGEELNEFVVTGTMAALKAATAVAGKKALAGGAKMLAGKAGLKAVAKPTISNISKAGGEAVKRAAGNPMVQNQAMMSANQPKEKTNKTSTISAGADLFDIVKGQLLDEGLSEEEIKDIMLTLTPDEILSELSGDLLRRATVAAGDKAMKLASQKDTAGAVKKLEQQKKFSGAMKKKNLENQARESNRKPTQYDSPLTKPMMDYSKPYPKASD